MQIHNLLKKGIVIKSTGSWYTVKGEDNELINCKIKGKFRIKGIKSTNPIAVGDLVGYNIVDTNDSSSDKPTGVITSISDRKNYIVRKSQNLSKLSHIIAANIDQAFLVVTINYPVTTKTFIDRFLASAEAYRIPVVLIFNKTDRYNADQNKNLENTIDIYENIGYQCIMTSTVSNQGIPELMDVMKGKTNVFNGHSGVGKSTIINCVQPGLKLKTKEISSYHNTGKHTTVHTEMFELHFGGYIIDTPGIKGYGMLNMEAWEISHYFPEIFKLSTKCQYNNCSHTHEPECAVKDAVSSGKIAESRFISYLGLLEGDEKHRLPQ